MSGDVVTIDSITLKNLHVYELEAWVLTQPQIELPVEHHFCAGLYARSLFIPAGTLLTGAVHKEESFFLIRSGTLRITTDHGVITVIPGFMSKTEPGTKRVGFALTDVICTTFHANPTNEETPNELWDRLTIPPPENLAEILEMFSSKEVLS